MGAAYGLLWEPSSWGAVLAVLFRCWKPTCGTNRLREVLREGGRSSERGLFLFGLWPQSPPEEKAISLTDELAFHLSIRTH
jgi:hypothetical protein